MAALMYGKTACCHVYVYSGIGMEVRLSWNTSFLCFLLSFVRLMLFESLWDDARVALAIFVD
jgi:hypothetical protein